MDPVSIGLLVGAGTGLLKYQQDLDRERRQRKLTAEMTRTSPWTGMAPDPMAIPSANMMGSVMQGGLSGGTFGQKVAAMPAGPAPDPMAGAQTGGLIGQAAENPEGYVTQPSAATNPYAFQGPAPVGYDTRQPYGTTSAYDPWVSPWGRMR